MNHWKWLVPAGLLLATNAVLTSGTQDFNFRVVKPNIGVVEKKAVPNIWCLNFRYRPPRYITVETEKGRQIYWYMTYVVHNETDQEHTFEPEFLLIANDKTVHLDELVPRAMQAVINREDPSTKLHDSVSISSKPIPPTPKEGLPIETRGVAFWKDPEGDGTRVNNFSIVVVGLSNGYTKVEDEKTKETVIRRKVLKIDFKKPGDLINRSETEIKWIEDSWTHR